MSKLHNVTLKTMLVKITHLGGLNNCHPGNRKEIIENHISNYKIENSNFLFYPVKSEELFSNNYIKENNLDEDYIDAFLASISIRNYTLLNNLDQQYSLQNMTFYPNNNVKALYDQNETYALQKIMQSPNFKPTFNYSNNVLPENIKYMINDDLKESIRTLGMNFKLKFKTPFFNHLLSETWTVKYKSEDDNMTFIITFQTCLYLISYLIQTNKIKEFDYELLQSLLVSLIYDEFKTNMIESNMNIKLDYESLTLNVAYSDLYQNLKYMFHLVQTLYNKGINLLSFEGNTNVKNNKKESLVTEKTDYLSLFGLNDDEYELIKDYNLYSDDYISEHNLYKGKKVKVIHTYKDNNEGNQLREIHQKIKDKLNIYFESSDISFAYKENSNTKMCLEKHILGNHFLKLDIKNFFNSIKLTRVVKKLSEILIDICANTTKEDILLDKNQLKEIISCCFYDLKLPIGFITSPIISDIYLNEFDKYIGSFNCTTTRYADDLLISSVEELDFDDFKNVIAEELSLEKLQLNETKTIKKSLIYVGDSIKFLGINLVKKEDGENRLTISNSFIMKTIEIMTYPTENSFPLWMLTLFGRVSYIKNISLESYHKFIHSFYIKTGINFFKFYSFYQADDSESKRRSYEEYINR